MMKTILKKRHFAMLVLVLTVAACGTIEGMGRDISSGADRASRLF